METKKREQIKDYTLFMLGAPVIKVELTPEHLDLCVDLAESDTEAYFTEDEIGERAYSDLIQHRALIKGMGILARIRGKLPNNLMLDGKQLRKDAKCQNAEWHYKVDSLQRRHGLIDSPSEFLKGT